MPRAALEAASSSEGDLDDVEELLSKGRAKSAAPDLRRRCDELADDLFESIGSQLTVERHKAISIGRGAFMDTIDQPLTDIPWLEANVNLIKGLASEEERLDAVKNLINRTNPGPGGFYDNFGSPESWKRIRSELHWEDDPSHIASPLIAFNTIVVQKKNARLSLPVSYTDDGDPLPSDAYPWAWAYGVHPLYDTPLVMRYDNLDPASSYDIRLVYISTRYKVPTQIRLEAAGGLVIHDWLSPKGQMHIARFPVSCEAYKQGGLELVWTTTPGCHGPFISEIWLIQTV